MLEVYGKEVVEWTEICERLQSECKPKRTWPKKPLKPRKPQLEEDGNVAQDGQEVEDTRMVDDVDESGSEDE